MLGNLTWMLSSMGRCTKDKLRFSPSDSKSTDRSSSTMAFHTSLNTSHMATLQQVSGMSMEGW